MIVRISDGLGNPIFSYAFAKALAEFPAEKIVIASEQVYVRDSGYEDTGFVPESRLKLAVDF